MVLLIVTILECTCSSIASQPVRLGKFIEASRPSSFSRVRKKRRWLDSVSEEPVSMGQTACQVDKFPEERREKKPCGYRQSACKALRHLRLLLCRCTRDLTAAILGSAVGRAAHPIHPIHAGCASLAHHEKSAVDADTKWYVMTEKRWWVLKVPVSKYHDEAYR
jgi:hypothetical protein